MTYLLLFLRSNSTETANLIAADRALTKAEELAPDAVETLIVRAFYHYWGFRDYGRAEALFRRVLEKAPRNAEVWAGLGAVMRRAGRFDEAIAAWEKARRLDPTEHIHIIGLGGLYSVLGRFREADELLASAKLLAPGSFEVALARAEYALNAGRPKRAWNELISLVPRPNDWRYFDFLCEIALRLMDADKIETALEIWPEEQRSPAAYPYAYELNKAVLLEITGRTGESRERFDSVSARAKANPPATWRDWQTKFSLALWANDADALQSALEYWRENKTKDAWEDIVQLERFAFAFARSGDLGKALDVAEEYVEMTAPSMFLRLSIIPYADRLRDHPRYLALEAKFEEWAKANGYEDLIPEPQRAAAGAE